MYIIEQMCLLIFQLEALFQIGNLNKQIQTTPLQWIIHKALEASTQRAMIRNTSGSRYSQVMKWFNNNACDIKNLPPFQYFSPLQNDENNQGIVERSIYGSSIPKRLGSHQGIHFSQRWRTTKINLQTSQRMDSYRDRGTWMSTCPIVLTKQ